MSRKKLETLEQQVETATKVENISESTTEVSPKVSKYAKLKQLFKVRNVLRITIPIFTLGLGFGISHYMCSKTNDELNQNISVLRASQSALVAQNMQLMSTNESQRESIDKDYILLDEYTNLQEKYTALQNDYTDLSDKLTATKAQKKKVEVKYEKLVQTTQVSDNVRFYESDVRKVSGASAATLNKLLKGTWLEGYGQVFHDQEEKHGINALFSIGNAILETGWDGDNYLSRNKNNIYGIATSRYFESKEDCIDYWFNLIDDHYVGETTKLSQRIA